MSEPIYDILKVKDNLGIWHVIPALKGNRGNGIASIQFGQDGTMTITDDDGEVTTYTGITSALAAIGTKEQEITAAELSRELAEQTRAGAEAARQNSETIRRNAETVRNADEALRRNAESARDAAELQRASAESTRQENEATRQSNENSRQDAEAARAAAETGRVEAEAERVTEFEEMQDTFELKANKVSAWQATPDDTHYPTEKLVKDWLDGKVDTADIMSKLDALRGNKNSFNLTEFDGTFNVNGATAEYDSVNNRLKLYGTANSTRFLGCLGGQLQLMSTASRSNFSFPAGYYIVHIKAYGENVPSEFVNPSFVYVLGSSMSGERIYVGDGGIINVNDAFSGGIWIRNFNYGTSDSPTFVEFSLEQYSDKRVTELERKDSISHKYVDIGGDWTIVGDESSAVVVEKYSISKIGTKIVLNGPSSSANIRYKIANNLKIAATNANVDSWSTGITLVAGHRYKAVMRYVSGTITTEGELPTFGIYLCGEHVQITYVEKYRCNTYDVVEIFDAPSYQVNPAIYLDSHTKLEDVTYLVTIEDITGDEPMVSKSNISSGQYFTINDRLYLATAAIASDEAIVPGTNCTETDIAAALNALNT